MNICLILQTSLGEIPYKDKSTNMSKVKRVWHLFLPVDWWRYIDQPSSDTGDLINPTFEVVQCTSTRGRKYKRRKNIRSHSECSPASNMFTWDSKSVLESERADVKSSVRCKTLGFPIHGFGRIPVAVGSRILPADQFIQSDAGRAGKSDRNETQKQTNLYIILKPG